MHKERPQRLHARLTRGLSLSRDLNLDYPTQPVSVTHHYITGGLWAMRLETHRAQLLPHAWAHLRHNIDNFRKAAGTMEGPHEGLHWDDSDLFKVMEGAALALAQRSDAEAEAYLEDLIRTVAGGQEPDGYLYTARTIDPENPTPGAGPARWSFMPGSHELYCMGHMIEAAIAHCEATGRRDFLNIALLNANLLVSTFGKDHLRDVCGHQEIEMALARLYRLTGDARFLNLCRFFLDERGYHTLRKSYRDAEQDHLPVLEQKVPVGHAVRATYMYAAMTDIAAMQDDQPYAMASEHLWREVVEKRMALTGAVGALHDGEAFGEPYELPNLDPHNETCAAIGLMLWSHRLFLLSGDGKYLDVLERALYNAYLSSHSIDGKSFFYCNPLEARESHGSLHNRAEWQGCACCPTNVARITPSVPGWAYAVQDDTLFCGLFMEGEAEIALRSGTVRVTQQTGYPWEGRVRITVEAISDQPFHLEAAIRIPGWATGNPVPGDLYRYVNSDPVDWTLALDERPILRQPDRGFVRVGWTARPGEAHTLELDLPMPIRRAVGHAEIESTKGKVALERGPITYCVEGMDHGGSLEQISLPDDAELRAEWNGDLLGGVTVLRSGDAGWIAVPYYAWNNRGPGEMAVWLNRVDGGF